MSPAAHFYVSAIDGTKKFLIAGPYPTHDDALQAVPKVRRAACDQDCRADFMSWGTAGSPRAMRTPMGAV
jgi:hypothetical protein